MLMIRKVANNVAELVATVTNAINGSAVEERDKREVKDASVIVSGRRKNQSPTLRRMKKAHQKCLKRRHQVGEVRATTFRM
jgi:hypothetical protein